MATLLLVGATGFLGTELLKTLASVPNKRISVLVRPETLGPDAPPAKQARLQLIRDLGVEVRAGSLDDKALLLEALRGIDIVLSAVGVQAILSQINLIEAIAEVGTVKRFVPSDFGYDTRLDPEGSVPNQMVRAICSFCLGKFGLQHYYRSTIFHLFYHPPETSNPCPPCHPLNPLHHHRNLRVHELA